MSEGRSQADRRYLIAALLGALVVLVVVLIVVLMRDGPSGGAASTSDAAPLVISGGETEGSPAVIAGWDTSKPLGAAIRALGEPTALKPDNSGGCEALWADIRMTANFYNLGGLDPCAPDGGKLSYALMRGPQWETQKGLRVGDSVRQLREHYPTAKSRVGDGTVSIDVRGWLLLPYWSGIGDGGWASKLVAIVDADHVTAFRVDAYSGGE